MKKEQKGWKERLVLWWQQMPSKRKIGIIAATLIAVFTIGFGSYQANQFQDGKQRNPGEKVLEESKTSTVKKKEEGTKTKASDRKAENPEKDTEKRDDGKKEEKEELKAKTMTTSKTSEKEEPKKAKEGSQPAKERPTAMQESNPSTTNPSASTKPSKDPHEGKTWHDAVTETKTIPAVTEQRWVVDSPERTEQIQTGSVYVVHETGARLSNDVELEVYMEWYTETYNKPLGSYSVEPVYETKTIPAQGHYEMVTVTPERTETTIIREAGWY